MPYGRGLYPCMQLIGCVISSPGISSAGFMSSYIFPPPPPGLSDDAESKAALSRDKRQQEECRRCCRLPCLCITLAVPCLGKCLELKMSAGSHYRCLLASCAVRPPAEGAVPDHKDGLLQHLGRGDKILHVLSPWGTQGFITGVSKCSKKGPDYCPSDFRGQWE